jgi:drug/metabolite transporter (DMT)-like permease
VVSLLGLALWPFESWHVPSWQQLSMLTGAALLLLVAYFLMIVAMRGGELAVIAPFRYSIVLWALTSGFVVWGEVPDAAALAGTIMVIVAGLYTFWRERLRS